VRACIRCGSFFAFRLADKLFHDAPGAADDVAEEMDGTFEACLGEGQDHADDDQVGCGEEEEDEREADEVEVLLIRMNLMGEASEVISECCPEQGVAPDEQADGGEGKEDGQDDPECGEKVWADDDEPIPLAAHGHVAAFVPGDFEGGDLVEGKPGEQGVGQFVLERAHSRAEARATQEEPPDRQIGGSASEEAEAGGEVVEDVFTQGKEAHQRAGQCEHGHSRHWPFEQGKQEVDSGMKGSQATSRASRQEKSTTREDDTG